MATVLSIRRPSTHHRAGPTPTDAVLVRAAQQGHEWAQEELFQRHAHAIDRLACLLTGASSEAEDLVQDVFVQALVSIRRLREPNAFPNWLRGIALRTAVRRLRRRRLLRRLGLAGEAPVDLDNMVSPTASPEIVWELRRIYRQIQEFPVDVKVAFLLRKVEALTITEIAEQTGVSQGAVKRRLKKAELLLSEHQTLGGHP
jgi:RNA polymerase sigma-70 factor (ECF subfamily)